MPDSQPMRSVRKQIISPARCAIVALIVWVFVAASGLLHAQTGGTGAITGAITDPSGARLVGAQVKVTDDATGDVRTAQSNASGLYNVSLLPPGQYTVVVTKEGFKEASSTGVQVIVAEAKVLDMPMETGAVTEVITVATSNTQLQTESSELGRVTDSEMIEDLPLVTRNYTQIVALNPGVSQEVNNAGQEGRGGGSEPGNPAGGSIISQGGTSVDNNFEMNGLPVDDIQSSAGFTAGIPVPNPDTIQEFKVQTTLFDATSGRDAGADVDVITKGVPINSTGRCLSSCATKI